MHNQSPQERTCPGCGSVFITQNPTRKFCTTNCKSAFERNKKKQQAQQQAQQVQHQQSEINQLKTRPQPQPPGPLNPAWRAADLRCQAQQGRCDRSAKALETTRRDFRQLTGPGWGFWLGAGVGIFLVALGMAEYLEARRRQRLGVGVSFGVVSAGSLGLLSLLGGWLGNTLQRERMSDEEAQKFADDRQRLREQETTQIDKLATEECRREDLIWARDAIDPYGAPPADSAEDAPTPPSEPT